MFCFGFMLIVTQWETTELPEYSRLPEKSHGVLCTEK